MLNDFNRKDVSPLRYWVHAILPLVYDDSLSYYEVLAKMSIKMDEVISGLNRNNEQVEKVTQFTTEQVQNLTAAFNNFQESMLTRQGEFENTLLDEQHSFETRLDGEIAQWEENTTEHFEQMYQDFLSAYQRQFGVVQTTGDSMTDVMSQDASTKLLFNTPIYVTPTNYQTVLPDLNTADYNGIYLLIFANGTTQENLPANLPFNKWAGYRVRVLFNLIPVSSRNGAVQLLYDPQAGTWYYRYHGTDAYGIWLTDATKSKFGMPLYVDSTNYQTVLPDLNTADYNGIYLLNFANGTTQENLPANLPFNKWAGYSVRVLFNLIPGSSRMGAVQMLYEPQTGTWYYRYHGTDAYGIWFTNEDKSKFGVPLFVQSTNYTSVLPDLNTADYNGIYLLNFANGTTQENLPANLPFNKWAGYSVRVLFNLIPGSSRMGAVQLLYDPQTGTWYYRYYAGGTYGIWHTDATKSKFGVPLFVQPTNYTSVLPDLNTADYNGIYLLNFANGTTQENLPANLPFNKWVGYGVRVLFNLIHGSSRMGAVQMLYDPRTGDWYYRYHGNNEYGEWVSPNKPKTITVSKTGGDYSSILVAVLNSKSYDTIIVEKGEYDLEQEFKDYYGDDFFDNFDESSPKGIYLGNHIHLIFSSDALVKFNYEGNNSAVFRNFSPFLSSTYGFTLENLTLTASRCRYCIHDERNSTKDSYKNVYLNCNLTIDNKELDNSFRQCIGGGLGYAGEIIIKDCIFNSIAEHPFEAHADVSYHNSKQDNAKSNIVISGCYFNNRLKFSWYGESTKVSTMLVTNNRFGGGIIEKAETSEYDNRNTQVIAFNNVIE